MSFDGPQHRIGPDLIRMSCHRASNKSSLAIPIRLEGVLRLEDNGLTGWKVLMIS